MLRQSRRLRPFAMHFTSGVQARTETASKKRLFLSSVRLKKSEAALPFPPKRPRNTVQPSRTSVKWKSIQPENTTKSR